MHTIGRDQPYTNPPASDDAPQATSTSAAAESDTDDLEVRLPLPGSAVPEVEKSPTKQGRITDALSSQHLEHEAPFAYAFVTIPAAPVTMR